MNESEAKAAVEHAEHEPLLTHRVAAVRIAIDTAARILDESPEPAPAWLAPLRARVLLRLASVKLAETDYEGVDQALEAVARHVPDDTVLRFLAGIRACRVAIRRGPEPRKLAHETLLNAAARLPSFDTGAPGWSVITTEVALAIAELALHDDPPDASAFEPIADIAANLDEPEVAYAGNQLVAAYALSIGDADRAAHSLRAAVVIARDLESHGDEVESRIALASTLVALDNPVALEEATRTIQIARDRALEHGLDALHQATLLAQAGVLAHAGKTAGAIDRVLELARAAVAAHDVAQYVAAVGVMAELYARSGDHVSAFRTIAEAHAALSTATNTNTTDLFRPLLARLRDRVGEQRLAKIAADVDTANRLAAEIAVQKSSNPD